MNVLPEIARAVRERARDRCQYCRMHQSLQGATFHLEHVVPQKLGGPSDLSNLALACPSCNLHKSDRVDAIDPDRGDTVSLFHPLRDNWTSHFYLEGMRILGRTSIGRATVETLKFNTGRRIKIRSAEAMLGLFSPGPD